MPKALINSRLVEIDENGNPVPDAPPSGPEAAPGLPQPDDGRPDESDPADETPSEPGLAAAAGLPLAETAPALPDLDAVLGRPSLIPTPGQIEALGRIKDAERDLLYLAASLRNCAYGPIDQRELAIARTALAEVVFRLHRAILGGREVG